MPPRPLGGLVVPGVGAIVAIGGDDGLGAKVAPGAGVLNGMPGMGAVVGSRASAGPADIAISAARRQA